MRSPPSASPHWHVDIVGLAVVAAVTVVVVAFGFKPVLDQRLDRAHQQRQVEAQREQVQAMAEASARLRVQLSDAQEAIEQSELRLLPIRQLNRRVASLTELADQTELDLDEIQPGVPAAGRRYEQVPIVLAGEADYAACALFLHQLARRFTDVTVTAMELTAAATPEGRIAAFRFTLSWHAAPPRADQSGRDRERHSPATATMPRGER